VTSDIGKIPLQERAEWVSASQVEMLGTRDDWDAIIFPTKTVGRDVKAPATTRCGGCYDVFPDGPRVRDAVLGSRRRDWSITRSPRSQKCSISLRVSATTNLATVSLPSDLRVCRSAFRALSTTSSAIPMSSRYFPV